MLAILSKNRVKYYCVNKAQEFGKRVAEARKQKGLNQRDFGEAIGVSPTYVSYIERGYNPASKDNSLQISDEVAEKLARYFGWDVDDTLEAVGYAPRNKRSDRLASNESETHEIVAGVRIQLDRSAKLNEADKKRILDVVRLLASEAAADKEKNE